VAQAGSTVHQRKPCGTVGAFHHNQQLCVRLYQRSAMPGKAAASLSSVVPVVAATAAIMSIIGYEPDRSEIICAFIGILGFTAIHLHSKVFKRVRGTSRNKNEQVSMMAMSCTASCSSSHGSVSAEAAAPEDSEQDEDERSSVVEDAGQDGEDAYDALLDDCEACCVGSMEFVLLVEHWASEQGLCTVEPTDGLLPMTAWRVLAIHFLQVCSAVRLPPYMEIRERADKLAASASPSEPSGTGADVSVHSSPRGSLSNPVELFRQFVSFYSIEFKWCEAASLHRVTDRVAASPPTSPGADKMRATVPRQLGHNFVCPSIEDPFTLTNLAQAMTPEAFERTHSELFYEHSQCNCDSHSEGLDSYSDVEVAQQCHSEMVLQDIRGNCSTPNFKECSVRCDAETQSQCHSEMVLEDIRGNCSTPTSEEFPSGYAAIDEQVLRQRIEVVASRQLNSDRLQRRRTAGLFSWSDIMTIYLAFPQSGIL